MPILGHKVKCSALLILIAKQLSEEIRHLHSAFLGTHPECRKWQISMTVNLQGGKKTQYVEGTGYHTCPRWLWIPWCCKIDLSILAGAPWETQALGQHAAPTRMTKRSSHISRHVWWRRDGREGILQLVTLTMDRVQESKGQSWLQTNMITNIDHYFQTF